MNTLKTLFTASAIALSLGGAALASDSTEIGNPGMYASAGKLYTVQNVKMAGGHMLYDVLSPGNPNYVPDSKY